MRSLEREIGAVCRHVAMRIAEGRDDLSLVADAEAVEKILGAAALPAGPGGAHERARASRRASRGRPSGGDILFIEATRMPGKGEVLVTGNLRSVMSESAATAVSFVRSHAKDLGLDPEFLKATDLHLHVPKGGTPKDGPSAGVTMFSAVASLLLAVRR